MNLRDLFIKYIPDHFELEEFAVWAFGSSYETHQGIVFLKAWNDRHGEKISIDPYGQVTDDSPNMVQLWKHNK